MVTTQNQVDTMSGDATTQSHSRYDELHHAARSQSVYDESAANMPLPKAKVDTTSHTMWSEDETKLPFIMASEGHVSCGNSLPPRLIEVEAQGHHQIQGPGAHGDAEILIWCTGSPRAPPETVAPDLPLCWSSTIIIKICNAPGAMGWKPRKRKFLITFLLSWCSLPQSLVIMMVMVVVMISKQEKETSIMPRWLR